MDGADGHIAAFLGHHLGPLDLRHAAVGVEDGDADAVHILEAFQRGLAGVTGGSGEDHDVLLHSLDGLGGGEQLGQHGKCHILKSGSRAPEQFQHAEIAYRNGGGQVFGLEFSSVGLLHQLRHIGDIRQQSGEDHGGHIHGRTLQTGLPVECGQGSGHIQAAVGSQAFQYGLSAVSAVVYTAGGMI